MPLDRFSSPAQLLHGAVVLTSSAIVLPRTASAKLRRTSWCLSAPLVLTVVGVTVPAGRAKGDEVSRGPISALFVVAAVREVGVGADTPPVSAAVVAGDAGGGTEGEGTAEEGFFGAAGAGGISFLGESPRVLGVDRFLAEAMRLMASERSALAEG